MILALPVSAAIGSIDQAAQFLIASGAGLGSVLILRWYWWRVNAWSEISATIAPFVALSLSKVFLEPQFGEAFVRANGSFYFTVGFTTLVWLVVTFNTPATHAEVLKEFYRRVRPDGWWKGSGWGHNRFQAGLLLSWFSAVVFTYSTLFGMGALIFQMGSKALFWLAAALVSAAVLVWSMRKYKED
jgi:hypothetical protein